MAAPARRSVVAAMSAVATADTAREALSAGPAAARATGDPLAVALALEGLAGARLLAGGAGVAAGLLGAAAASRRSVGMPLPAGERDDVDRISAGAEAALGAVAYAAGFARGEALGPDA